MFSQLGALASKGAKPKPKTSASTTLPSRRDREQEEEAKKKQEEENTKKESSSDDDENVNNNNIITALSVEEEKEMLQQLRTQMTDLDKKLQELFSSSEENNDNKKQKVLTWIQLQIKRWRYDLLVQKRKTDPDDVDAMEKCFADLHGFSNSQTEIQPMLEGLGVVIPVVSESKDDKNNDEKKKKNPDEFPQELLDHLLKVIEACRQKRFLEAENIYFQALLGNENWHLGIFAVGASIKQEHSSFLRENVKSNLHNHELRKMMVVFKELIMKEKGRCENIK